MSNPALQQGMSFLSSSVTNVQRAFSKLKSSVLLAASARIAVDVVLCSILLVVLAPVMGIIAIAVAFDGGPVLVSHEWIGKGGQRFNCLKFRSMVPSADEVLDRCLANDHRITHVGRFLRATGMDNLPQLFNVLRLNASGRTAAHGQEQASPIR